VCFLPSFLPLSPPSFLPSTWFQVVLQREPHLLVVGAQCPPVGTSCKQNTKRDSCLGSCRVVSCLCLSLPLVLFLFEVLWCGLGVPTVCFWFPLVSMVHSTCHVNSSFLSIRPASFILPTSPQPTFSFLPSFLSSVSLNFLVSFSLPSFLPSFLDCPSLPSLLGSFYLPCFFLSPFLPSFLAPLLTHSWCKKRRERERE
jgi:hypothetical protein